jgi:hypothetical protein
MNIKNEIIEHYKKFFDLHAKGISLDEDDHLNIDWAVNFFESHLSTKDKEIENLEKEKELILQQARCWAFEAKTQRNTVNQVGSLLGGIPDWGAIVKGVREKIEKSESVLKEMEEALTMCKESFLIIKNEISSVDIISHHEIDSRVKMINNRLDTYNKLKEL